MTGLCPYGETGLHPYGETGLRPYGETGLCPYGETSLFPYGETSLLPNAETCLWSLLRVVPSAQKYEKGILIIIVLQREGWFNVSRDGRERSGSGETQARPKATGLMIEKHALVH